jgi:LPXTG-motif cell wall-anchored protein
MSSGSNLSWRLLSPLIALCWAIGTVSLAGTSDADKSTDGTRAATPAAAHAATPAATHAATPAQDHQAEPAHPVKGKSTSKTTHGGTSGDVNSPQPISKADANSGGANGQCPGGPYCSTRDGSPSGNGNGGGKAVGKPCAGCVGKADNKNPKGQMPDASDANAGYECDTNHGIARTNPAHTGCVPSTPECVPTPEVPCVSPPECVPTPEVPCVSPPQAGPPTPPQVSPPSHLPNTGAPADLVSLTAAAFASMLAGIGLLGWRRRRLHVTEVSS